MVGFSLKNKESLDSVYICPQCSLLLRDPVQLLDCAHRLCQSCVNEQESDMIMCSECHHKTPRSKLIVDRGFKNDMQALLVVCSLCEWIGILKNYQNHLDEVHSNPICDYCGEKSPSVNDLDRHKQYECTKNTVDCPLKQFGCEETILRVNLSQHYRSEQHQIVLVNVVRHSKSILPNVMYNHSEISAQMTTHLSHATENVQVQLQEINETTDILSNGIEILNDDLQRLNTESIHHQNALEPMAHDLLALKTSIQEQNAFLDRMKMNQEILQQQVASGEQKINDNKTSSYNGTLIWKISNVQEKMADAKSERRTSIYSTPFYSSPTGYKMCARLYLNGDGKARGTHMSLFFVLMRGEYDAILRFPFHFKVTLCLYDQTSEQHHITDSFWPDIKSNSFQRPHSDMNIASGIPNFVSLSILQQEKNPYIRDDTMFIRIMVDFNDMPKALLLYALSLNPGLTTSMQQTMVRHEIERQQQLQSTNSTIKTEAGQLQYSSLNAKSTDPIRTII